MNKKQDFSRRNRMSFDIPAELQAAIRSAAIYHRLSLGELAKEAFERELARLEEVEPEQPSGLRRGRPVKRPSKRPSKR